MSFAQITLDAPPLTDAGVYGYIRVSSTGQIDKSGAERQEALIRDYVERHGLSLKGIFSDLGVSGTLADRPGFYEMLEAISTTGVGCVIIERLDRLARDLMVQETIIARLQLRSISLISVTEGPDLAGNDPTRKLLRQFMGAIAEYDKTMLVNRLAIARAAARARDPRGKCGGRSAFGETGDPEEMKAIERIWQLRELFGFTAKKAAKILNDDNKLLYRGQKWKMMNVYQIQRSWVYKEQIERLREELPKP